MTVRGLLSCESASSSSPLSYFLPMGGGGGPRIFLGLKFWPKGIF